MIQGNEWVFSMIVIEKALISGICQRRLPMRDKYISNVSTDSIPVFSNLKGKERERQGKKKKKEDKLAH